MRRDGTGLERRTLDVGGLRRTYWLARGPDGEAPLLMMRHGSGTTGRDVATTFTGLATRGPAAGVTAVFPEVPRHLDATKILLEEVTVE